jgi:hypothetical protein
MKTQNIILSVILMLVLVFSACREITVTTKVNRDGSFTRIITVTGDSTEVNKGSLPFPVDGTWEKKSFKDIADNTRHILTYTKTFRNSDDLNTELKNDTTWYHNIKREISVKKRFGFFFTYLSFHEKYKSMNPFTYVDYKDYLTEDDVEWFIGLKMPVTPADSATKKAVEDKVDQYFEKSITTEIEGILRAGIKRLDNPALDTSVLTVYHDSIANAVENWQIKSGDQLIDAFRDLTGNEAWSGLKGLQPPIFADFDHKITLIDTLFSIEGYTEVVEMPGLITATNSPMLKGNQVSWEFSNESILIRDYEMYIESRVINYWAFVLAGVVVFGLVVLLVVKAFRR